MPITKEEIGRLSPSQIHRFWSRVEIGKKDQCWPWLWHFQKNGYGKIEFNHITYTSHRLSFALTFGALEEEGLCVLHKCDNKWCCNPYHYFLGDYTKNNRDTINKGRRGGKGIKKPHLKAFQREEVKERLLLGETYTKIAKDFNVSPMTISRISRPRK